MTKLDNKSFKKDKRMMDLNNGSITKEQEDCDHDFGELDSEVVECEKCGLKNMTYIEPSESDWMKMSMGWWQ